MTLPLNSGVPATEVAAWAGHSVEMLMRVYARCVAGLEGVGPASGWRPQQDSNLRSRLRREREFKPKLP
jgi:hypothetical protein